MKTWLIRWRMELKLNRKMASKVIQKIGKLIQCNRKRPWDGRGMEMSRNFAVRGLQVAKKVESREV